MTTRITTENITDATIGTADLASSVPLNTQWQAVVTASTLNAVAGRGYFIDTTSNTCTVTLPGSPSAGDFVVLKDYARNWNSNNVLTASALFDGTTNAITFSTNGQTVTLVYMDGTKGWSLINEDTTTSLAAQFISATGGTVTTSGDFKIHTFTGDGCFVVSNAGNPAGSTTVDYLVVAGGGSGPTTGGGDGISGGGGAGGFRFYANPTCNPQSGPGAPLNGPAAISVPATTYPITVGGGGAITSLGSPGSNSVFSTITSTGGGRGGRGDPNANGQPGGSGGGGNNNSPAGNGNTPPVSPAQGNNGGAGGTSNSGGGGGATASGGAGQPTPGPKAAGIGGNGAGVTGFGAGNGECSSCVQYFAGGGGGGNGNAHPGVPGGSGGLGGGGNGIAPPATSGPAGAGTANTGGGGGGASDYNPGGAFGGVGGSGIVIIRYKFQ